MQLLNKNLKGGIVIGVVVILKMKTITVRTRVRIIWSMTYH